MIEDEHVQTPVIGIGVSPFEQHHLEAFFQSFPHELNASFIVVQNHVTGDCITDLKHLFCRLATGQKRLNMVRKS
ncbi:hypothetical protein ACEQPO_07010 [Bacillus sp. SL00103]